MRNLVAGARTRRLARPKGPQGWTPWEPGLLALALILLGASGVFSWWGTTEDISRLAINGTRGLDVAPFSVATWELYFFSGGFYRAGEIVSWWDFASAHPKFAGYSIVAIGWMSLWLAGLLLAGLAFVARAVPRSRMKSIPTYLEGVAAATVAAAALLVILALPGAFGFTGLSGAEGKLAWGSRLGLQLAIAASVLMGTSSTLGLRVDRALRGVCWNCHRAATGNRCGYCEAVL